MEMIYIDFFSRTIHPPPQFVSAVLQEFQEASEILFQIGLSRHRRLVVAKYGLF